MERHGTTAITRSTKHASPRPLPDAAGPSRTRPGDEATELEAAFAKRTQQAFARGAGHGLLRLGGGEVGQILPPVFAYWRDFGSRYVTAVCTRPDVEDGRAEIPAPPAADLEALASSAPVMPGAEYLTPDVLRALWNEIGEAFATEIAESRCTVPEFLKKLADQPGSPYAPLRDLVRPYILRRLKTDRSVISDLPDKTEMKAFCPLSRKQAALYQQAVEELAARVGGVEGIRRKGLVLAFLVRFKQICNHPSQWLGDGVWAEDDSIGQKKNVLVHKFVCRGTVEEKIDHLIASKQRLSKELLEGGGELNLTELEDAELLRLVALDLRAAMGE